MHPTLHVVAERGAPALGVGERAVVRYRARSSADGYEARIIRALSGAPDRVLGIYRRDRDGGAPRAHRPQGADRFPHRARPTAAAPRTARSCSPKCCRQRRFGLPEARIVERIGDSADPRAFSLIAIHTHGIPTEFPPTALDARREGAAGDARRRAPICATIPLVTIDGADARDFDDAVWAEPDPEAPGGWHALVAIADVAWYVRPDDALDRAARERGNSVYFPDRVVPMLPEALSNELCSLKPGVERACIAVHLWIDARRQPAAPPLRARPDALGGAPHLRGSAGRDRRQPERRRRAPLVAPVLRPLYGVFRALDAARRQRGTLDLDLPERRILLDPGGRVARIEPRQRLDSHRLIEELMIAANVAAAETLERLRQPCMYRVHDVPDPAKLAALREFLDSLGIAGLDARQGPGGAAAPFQRHPAQAAGTPYETLVHQAGAAQPGPGGLQPDAISAISASACAAMRISPRRSGAMPTFSSIAR